MQILNIAGYQFMPLNNLKELKMALFCFCNEHALKGTILLSTEGININLAGTKQHIDVFIDFIKKTITNLSISFHETYSHHQPFKRLKIKLKKEIITFRHENISPYHTRAKSITPQQLKQWLDENKDFILLDTRNEYEIKIGSFKGAINPHIKHFCELPHAIKQIDKNKKIVMFCTGGIRCEKAALYMEDLQYKEVYQLEGGILGYFNKVGGAHFYGNCFVFDERIAISPPPVDR